MPGHRATHRDISRGLLFRVYNCAFVDDHGVSSAAFAEIPSNALAELGFWIAQEEDVVVLDPVGFAPGGHDKCIIESDYSYNIDGLALQLVELLDVSGQVAHTASRSKSTRYRKQDDLLARPLLGRVIISRDTAGCVSWLLDWLCFVPAPKGASERTSELTRKSALSSPVSMGCSYCTVSIYHCQYASTRWGRGT